MRTFIWPDVHNRCALLQLFLEKNDKNFDKGIFLGDFLDSHGDNEFIAEETALYLKTILYNPKYIFLFGNHDVTYSHLFGLYPCSGYTKEKQIAIDKVLIKEDWAKFSFAIEHQGWLITHAGVHPSFFPKGFSFEELTRLIERGIDIIPKIHPLFNAGWARGGMNNIGGFLWLDWNNEFEPIEGVKQLMGHTRLHSEPEKKRALYS